MVGRAFLELRRYPSDGGELSVENPPNEGEPYTCPDAITSPARMNTILAHSVALAAEMGAQEIELPCPSEIAPDPDAMDILDRQFAFAWLRKRL